MTERKHLSKKTSGILIGIITVVLLGCTLIFTQAFSQPILAPIKATIIFPEENVATAIWWRDSGTSTTEDPNLWSAASGTYYPEGMEPRKDDGYDIIKPIGEYDNVVSVDSPTADQIIVRETYPVTENGITKMHEIIVWGNGSCISRPIT